MKTRSTLSIIAALSLAASASLLAQGRPEGGRGPRPGGPGGPGGDQRPDPAVAAAHMTEAFSKVSAFDINKDGKLDETEIAALAKAVADGSVTPPAHRKGPEDTKPNPDRVAHRLAGAFSAVSAFDTNHDGKLDESETAALKTAMEKGEVRPPGGPRGGRGERGPGPEGDGGRPPRGGRGPAAE